MNYRNTARRLMQTTSLCAAVLSLGVNAPQAGALDVSGLVTVNGQETSNVLVGVYDCANGAFLNAVRSGATFSSNGVPQNFFLSVQAENVRLEFYHSDLSDVPLADQCRAFADCSQVRVADGKAVVSLDMICVDAPVATGVSGPGYWKNHPEAWPVQSVRLGGVGYDKAHAIQVMRLPEKGDKTKNLFRHLLAARLNVLAGNDSSCIEASITRADAWLMRNPVGSNVRGNSRAWKEIAGVVVRLDAYNSGLLCAPSHDGNVDDEGGSRD
jgi:hypothetical protein